MGHPQPPTPVHCDNSTAVGISNSTVKRQRSRAMEMRYFWVVDQVMHQRVRVLWYPGMENLGNYVTKHHGPKHHQHARHTILTNPIPHVTSPELFHLVPCEGVLILPA
jgi:hypothetical protein